MIWVMPAYSRWNAGVLWQPMLPKMSQVKRLLFGPNGVDCTIKQLAEQVAAATGFVGEIQWDTSKPDGTPKKQLDVSRLKAMGWSAQIPLHQGSSDGL